MSTTVYANARELKDIANMLDVIQRMSDRLSGRSLSVAMGSIAIYNTEGAVVGYAEQENGVYAFKTVSEHIEQRDDDPSMNTGSISVITPEMLSGEHDRMEQRDLNVDEEPVMAQTVPMDEARERRDGNGSHAAHV